MRVLLDHCMPRRFGRMLAGHEIVTADSMGWQRLRNGELLAAAAGRVDVLVTVDRSLGRQQNLGALPMPVLVLRARSNSVPALSPLAPSVLRLLGTRLDRRVYVVGA